MPMALRIGRNFGSRGGHQGPTATDNPHNIDYILYTAGYCLARSSPPAHESTLFALASRNTGATTSPPRPSDIVPGQKVLEKKKPTDLDRQALPAPCQLSSRGPHWTGVSTRCFPQPDTWCPHASMLTTPEPWLIVYSLPSKGTMQIRSLVLGKGQNGVPVPLSRSTCPKEKGYDAFSCFPNSRSTTPSHQPHVEIDATALGWRATSSNDNEINSTSSSPPRMSKYANATP